MIPPPLISPAISSTLILATPTLLRSAALVAPAAVGISQARTCFISFRSRRNGDARRRDVRCTYAAQERYFGISEELKKERQEKDGIHLAEKWQRDFENKIEEMRTKQKEVRKELIQKWLAMDPYEVLFGRSEKLLKGVNVKDWDWGEFWHKRRGEKLWSEGPIYRKDVTETMTEVSPESRLNDMEYDPISNRMKMATKSEKVMSHYGQELDTANNIPVKPPPKPKPGQEIRSSPIVSDIQAELRQYKERRLPDMSLSVEVNAEAGKEPVVRGTKVEDGLKTSFSTSNAADRARLEESFTKIQKELMESWSQISVPGQLRSLHKLSTEVRNLGDTILKISNTIDQPSSGDKTPISETSKTVAEPNKVQAQTLKDLSDQVRELGQRLANISSKVATGETSKGPDVFPMIFGGKIPLKDTEAAVEKGDRLIQEEIKKLKDAMIAAEETEKVFNDPRINDTELQKEILNIYEKEYGEITPAHEQVQSSFAQASTGSLQSTPKQQEHESLETQKTTQETQSTSIPSASQDAVYTVLAYDPSTSEVSTTTLLAPISAEESTMPLTIALTQLSEPAKFLPHLRLLRENNFRAVSVTKNLLVLRGIPPSPVSTKIAKEAVVENITEQNNSPSINSQSSTSQSQENGRPAKRLEPFYTGSKNDKHQYRRRRERSFGKDMLSFTIKYVMITGAIIYLLGLKDGMKKVPIPKQAIAGESELQKTKN